MPINEDKQIIQRHLMTKVAHPKPASSADGIEQAVIDWDTSIRLFKAAGGPEPTCAVKRLTFIDMLPSDIGTYVTMHLELYPTYVSLYKFTIKYVKVLKDMKSKHHKPAHLIEEQLEQEEEQSQGGDYDEDELLAQLMATDNVEEQVEILAFVKTKGFHAPTRGQGGPRRFPPRSGAAPPRAGGPLVICHPRVRLTWPA